MNFIRFHSAYKAFGILVHVNETIYFQLKKKRISYLKIKIWEENTKEINIVSISCYSDNKYQHSNFALNNFFLPHFIPERTGQAA